MMRMSVAPAPSQVTARVAAAGNATATAAPSDVWVRSLPLWHVWNIATIVVATALALAGLVVPVDTLRPLALVSAVVSLAGIGLFLGTWPAFNTLAAIAVNVAVLVALLR